MSVVVASHGALALSAIKRLAHDATEETYARKTLNTLHDPWITAVDSNGQPMDNDWSGAYTWSELLANIIDHIGLYGVDSVSLWVNEGSYHGWSAREIHSLELQGYTVRDVYTIAR